MPQIKLTGLKASVPIGFMAALGAFRHASGIPQLGAVKLGWTGQGGYWYAELETANEVSADELAELFVARLRGMGERPEFTWCRAVKSASVEIFREAGRRALEEASEGEHSSADWLQALASELAHKENVLESTPFDMTAARQLFLADAKWLTESLAGPGERRPGANLASFREALFGPWKYEDDQHSLGWDPQTKLMGAFTQKAPTSMSKSGVRAAVWLAMESLPFFPCFFDRGLATCGVLKSEGKQALHWPIWESPLSMAAVRTLLAQGPGIELDDKAGRGLTALYSSAIYKPNKYLSSFQCAVLEA